MRPWLGVIAIVIAAGAAACPTSPVAVERWFSTGTYPRIQAVVTSVSNQLPLALFDVLVLAAVVGVIVVVARAIRAALRVRGLRPLANALLRLTAVAAVVYLVFLGLWGLNYRRVPMADRLVLTPASPQASDGVALARRAVQELNAGYDAAHAAGAGAEPLRDPSLTSAFAKVQRLLSDARPAVPGRLKVSVFGPYFRWASVDGMIDPFALEVLVNPDLVLVERPFVAAHEWAHLAGYASESEASFVGWLTCMHAGDAARYSGWLFVYWQMAAEVDAAERMALAMALAPGPRSDMEAVAARIQRGQLPALRRASWRVYDQYLKANRVESGVRSYSEVVSLMLRVRFEEGWTPVRRGSPPGEDGR
jgi:hypothetical protein